ncbi:MAG: hypothetical protein WCT49_03660 [Candidatus Paceibacterota bacterium]|jgi:hypothetical protein|nr:DUF4082 domain-containing protein [Candidatus Paceibacterota bacterium]
MKKIFNKVTKPTVNNQRGQVMLITVLMFLFISLSIVLGFGSAAMKNFKNTEDFFKSKQSYLTAESGLEDAVYRFTTGKPTFASMSLSLNGADAVTDITDLGLEKEIISTGSHNSLDRKVKTRFVPDSSGTSYSYGIQVGTGGFTLGNSGSGVNGNVYSNGDILGGASFITGTAVAADKVPMNIEQQNILPVSPIGNTIVFDDAAATQDFAQSFTPSTTTAINEVSFYIKRTSSAPTGTLTVRIMNDNGSGAPGATTLATGSFDSSFTTSYRWNSVTFSSHPTLTKDTVYWIVLDVSTTGSGTRNFILAANANGYARGIGRRGVHGGTWAASAGTDSYFQVCMGGAGSTIDNMVIGGDAIAHTITNSTVTGTLYCHVGTGNNKACTATTTQPVAKGFSLTQAKIDEWKAAAEAGGTIAGFNMEEDTSIGLKKIDGDLTTANGIKMTLTGVLWITGDYAPGGGLGQEVTLTPSYGENSGVIIVDGKIDLSNNILFSGSGNPNSFILLLTTSDCPDSAYCAGQPAITVGNNAGAVLLEAQDGTLHFNNNAGANEATAKKIELSNGATVTYEFGLADTHFTTGPGSGVGILNWREIQ